MGTMNDNNLTELSINRNNTFKYDKVNDELPLVEDFIKKMLASSVMSCH